MAWFTLLKQETGDSMFSMIVSEDVVVETQNGVRKRNPQAPGHTIALIRERLVEFCDEVIRDYPGLESSIFSDKYDWHVHSAIVAAGCNILVTNDAGFLSLSDSQLDELSFDVMTADQFLMLVHDSGPQFVSAVILKQVQHYARRTNKEPRKKLSDALRDSMCPDFAAQVDLHTQNLAGVNVGFDKLRSFTS